MTTTSTTTIAFLMSVAVSAAACGGTAPEEADRASDTVALHDACSGAVIGERDVETGELRFYAGDRVVTRDEIEELDAPRELADCVDPTQVQPSKLWATEHCWYISEGSVGCKGCAYQTGLAWEYCWDIQ